MSGTQPWVSVATALRRVCGVAALLGLFAMHGLAVHGAMHASHSADPMAAALAITGHDHGTGDAAMTGTRDDAPSGASHQRTPDPELLGLAGLCLAVLLAGVVAAVVLSRFIRLPRCPDPATAQGWPTRSRRDRDPPCLFALSIQRC